MSDESAFLQGLLDRKFEFLNNPAYSASRIGGRLDFGIEISIVEANRMNMEFRPDGRFSGSLSPGQKSYIRVSSSSFRETFGGLQWTPTGLRPINLRTGLRFPDPGKGASQRWHAYSPTSTNWIDEEPWRLSPAIGVRSVDISLIPIGARDPQPDGLIHVLVTGADRRTATASAIRLDHHTMQLVGYGASMDQLDHRSLWVLSFYLYMHPPE